MKTIRIFISSPGDVGQERIRAANLIRRLAGEFSSRLKLEPVLWEEKPLRATGHFQQEIPPPSKMDLVICILWSRLGTRLPLDKFRRPDGTAYNSGTEWEFEDAYASFQQRGVPDLFVYRKTAPAWVELDDDGKLDEMRRQKKALDNFLSRWFNNPDGTFKAAFAEFQSLDQFERKLELDLREWIKQHVPEPVLTDQVEQSWFKGSPFRGLEAFDFDDAPVFFGRSRAIGEIKERLVRQAARRRAFLMILGMSGCGKSSLIRAGVLPNITHRGVIDAVDFWCWRMVRPASLGPAWRVGLARELLATLPGLSKQGFTDEKLGDLLAKAPEHALILMENVVKRMAAEWGRQEGLGNRELTGRLCLVFDPLDDLFHSESFQVEDRRGFLALVKLFAHSGFIWTIAAMRSDYYARCGEIPDLLELKADEGQYDLSPPTFDEIGQMIRYPAQAAGLEFAVDPHTGERLEAALHEAAARDPGALPLLQFTLQELYRGRKENGPRAVLTWSAYRDLGGLEGALARRAEEVYNALPPSVKLEPPKLFRSLANLDLDNRFGSRRLLRTHLESNPAAAVAIQAFLDARLLISERNADEQALVGLAHEALFRSWPRLESWLQADLALLRERARISGLASWWRNAKHDPALLLHEAGMLREAEALIMMVEKDLEPATLEFIHASVASQKKRGRLLLTGILAFAVFWIIQGWTTYFLRPEPGLVKPGAIYDRNAWIPSMLMLFGAPLAIQIWRKWRREPGLSLLKAETRWYGLVVVITGAMAICSWILCRTELTTMPYFWTAWWLALAAVLFMKCRALRYLKHVKAMRVPLQDKWFFQNPQLIEFIFLYLVLVGLLSRISFLFRG